MLSKKIPLFTLLGFKVSIDPSWVIIALLVTWSLATGYFPSETPGLAPSTYWLMGAIGAIGLFASILFHEFFHSLTARQFGLPMSGITLFLFGGISEMSEEPHTPGVEFLVAIAGPASSVVLGLAFFGLYWLSESLTEPTALSSVLGYLAFINIVVAVFNMLPAFPLDGGRVLRSILWKTTGNLNTATRWASNTGVFFGWALMGLGVLTMFAGQVIAGIWYLIIGMFLQGMARGSYKQLVVRKNLQGEQVRDHMKRDPVTVASTMTVQDLVDHYIYKYHYKMFPVVDGDTLAGCVTTRHVKELDRDSWENTTVSDIARSCDATTVIGPDVDVIDALQKMSLSNNSRLMVVQNNRLEGIITLKDIMGFLSIRMDLPGYKPKRP